MNHYKIYFKDGCTKEVTACDIAEAKFKVLLITNRPSIDIERIVFL